MNQALPPGEFAKAFVKKRLAHRRRRILVWGGLGSMLALILVGVLLVFYSPVFAVRQVAVSGVAILTQDQVRNAAGIEAGMPLARLDVDAIRRRVSVLRPVAEVEVVRVFPGTVELKVAERKLSFQRAREGGHEWVDAHGVIYHRSARPAKGAIQAVSKSSDRRLLADIATVADNIPGKVRSDVESLSGDAVDRITLSLRGGRTVMWGSAEESRLKGEVLGVLLSQKARVYDVSAPRQPTTR